MNQASLIRPGFVLFIALLTSACSYNSMTLQETRELELLVSSGDRFAIKAGAGSLVLEGSPDLTSIEVTAEIYQDEPSDNYTLTLNRDADGQPLLISTTGQQAGNNAIALSIRVPESLPIFIDDGSGSIRIDNLAAALEIEDGSGSIQIERVDADVTIDDGSGSITINGIGGHLVIDDGSGSITINSVGGDLTLDDGSGSITVREVGGVVTVDDGSGSITVDGAEDFRLIDDGSGGINLSNIRSHDGER